MEPVWDCPRPPAVVPCERRVRVELACKVLADSTRALRVLETSHPPTIYIPPTDVSDELLAKGHARSTWCEFKGVAHYLDAAIDDRRFKSVAWTYPNPSLGYEVLRDHVAFYPGRVDAAWLDDKRVQVQQSGFYGGLDHRRPRGAFQGAGRHARLVKSGPNGGRSLSMDIGFSPLVATKFPTVTIFLPAGGHEAPHHQG